MNGCHHVIRCFYVHPCPVSPAFNESSLRDLGLKNVLPLIGWSFIRGKGHIAVVAGHVCQVVVDEGTFIQHTQSVKNDCKKQVVVNQGHRSQGVLLYCYLHFSFFYGLY